MGKITFKDLIGPMRAPFLILPPACVLLGVGTAYWTTGYVNPWYAVLALIGTLASHISVNAFNEYFDFKSGLDGMTQKTPFSGGSGTLQARPEMAHTALITAWAAFGLTGVIGIYFAMVRGLGIVPIGVLGLIIVYTYTNWITRDPVLCLLAPGLGFGTLWVMGTDFVLTGHYSWTAFAASLVPFFLVSNLLLLNQFPDVEADRQVGRRHFPILVGKEISSYIYTAFLALMYLSIITGIISHVLPAAALVGLLSLLLAVPAAVGTMRHAQDVGKLIPYMGMNVVVNIATPILVAVGLFIGRS
jgi:1,4-dihydroxy-2-naphthoate octaprenyltransferase